MVVDFPAPLGPRKPNTSPLAHLEADAVHGDEVAEAPRQVPDADGRSRRSAITPRLPRPGRGPRRRRPPATAESGARNRRGRRRRRAPFPPRRHEGRGPAPPTMDPVPEEADGGGGECLPAGPRRPFSGPPHRISRSVPRIEGAHLLRRSHREEPSVVQESDPVAPLRLVEVGGRDEDRHALPEETGTGSARSRGARPGPRRWSARRGRAPRGCGPGRRQSPSFCFMPPDRFPARRRRNGPRPLKASSRSMRGRPVAAGNAVDVGVEVEVLEHRQVGVEAEPLAHVPDLLRWTAAASPRT